MKNKNLLMVGVVLTVSGILTQTVLADMAPPSPPTGASISSSEPSTYVQMVSESVVMVVTDNNGVPYREGSSVSADMMVGHVQAYFKMVNQGTETETLEVRFPLGGNDGYSNEHTIEDFSAYVDGKLVQTTQQVDEPLRLSDWPEPPIPWATWQVTFPPGQIVNVGVDYEVRPEGWSAWGTFTYILETGAGWYGPIGEGTVVFRLPHEVSSLNVATSCEDSSALSASKTCDISGTDIKWHFSDLEPTREDNIHFTVLAPSVWRGIQRARKAAQTDPDSLDAQLRLAHAWREGLEFHHGLTCCWSLANEALAAYEQVIRLAPNSADMYVEYLEFMLNLWFPPEPESKPEQFDAVLEKALKIAPDDPRLLDIQSRVEKRWFPTATGTNHTPTSKPTSTSKPMSTSVVTRTPQPTRTSFARPASTPTTTLIATSTSTPTSWFATTPLTGIWVTVGAAVIGGVGIGVWIYHRRRVL
ncbi:MAG: hypothetical protein JXB07_05265 [Anaerolineae bacterium]|nr:hypothetical protein [Anaerolineae bacterium]